MDYNILVVDDDIGNRESIRMILKDYYNVSIIDNGKDAVELIKKENFHLVILDIIMPGMDGIEVLRKIKEINPNLKIIIVTATKKKDFADEIDILGVSGWIDKPFDVNEVRKVVKDILEKDI